MELAGWKFEKRQMARNDYLPTRLCIGLILPMLAPGLFAGESSSLSNVESTVQAQVREILREAPLIDGHNDLPWQFRKRGGDLNAIDLRVNNRNAKPALGTDIPRLRAGGIGGQFWSVYVPAELPGPEAVKAVFEQIDVVHRLAEKYSDTFELALTAADVERIHEKGKIASLIGME